MAETKLTSVFSKAGNYEVPLGTYMDKPKSLEIFQSSPAEWEKITNTQMIYISPAFAEKLFGTSAHANYAGILFEGYNSEITKPLGHRDTAAAERDLKEFIPLFKKAAAEFYDARTLSLLEQLPRDEIIELAGQTKSLHELRYGDAEKGKVFGSMNTYETPDGKKISSMALADTKDISLESSFPKDFFKSLGKTENFQFDPNVMRAYILAHELEHANQQDITHVTGESFKTHEQAAQAAYLKELDATISAKQTLEGLLPAEEFTKYMQVMDLAYLHAYMKRLGNLENPDMHVLDADHQTLPQMNDYFKGSHLNGEIADINISTKALAEKLAIHMGVSFSDTERMHKIYEITGAPSMGQMKTALQEMISDESNPLPPDQLSLASTYLESMDNLGIAGKDYTPIKEADAKITNDAPLPNKALFEAAIKAAHAPVSP